MGRANALPCLNLDNMNTHLPLIKATLDEVIQLTDSARVEFDLALGNDPVWVELDLDPEYIVQRDNPTNPRKTPSPKRAFVAIREDKLVVDLISPPWNIVRCSITTEDMICTLNGIPYQTMTVANEITRVPLLHNNQFDLRGRRTEKKKQP